MRKRRTRKLQVGELEISRQVSRQGFGMLVGLEEWNGWEGEGAGRREVRDGRIRK
jgi:hypothetical protein